MLVLDVSCQPLGDELKLMGFCVPFGHKMGKCTFLEYVSVEYICWYWIYHANTWGMNLIQWVSVDYGTVHLQRYILPTLMGCHSVGGCLCALRAPGWVMYIF